ncbi:MAG: DUF1080 domain-containing protein [Verrucomicrobia bacterium]|nr:DUF1080 domain-containing protein [Verrucomicrobiota bacterium]
MKNGKGLIFGCAVTVFLACSAVNAGAIEWKALFNGKDLNGWEVVNDARFEADDGCLRLVDGMGWLRTKEKFRDFELQLEWRALEERYDSGVFLRTGVEGKPWPKEGWQVNLRYDAPGGLVKGIMQVVPAGVPRIPVEKWSKLKLKVMGENAELIIDGETAWKTDIIDGAAGYIGIQAEDKTFEFRNIRIKKLDGEDGEEG